MRYKRGAKGSKKQTAAPAGTRNGGENNRSSEHPIREKQWRKPGTLTRAGNLVVEYVETANSDHPWCEGGFPTYPLKPPGKGWRIAANLPSERTLWRRVSWAASVTVEMGAYHD